MSIAIPLHLLAAVIWVGGMFFAHQVLRPVAADQLEPPARLRQWIGVFGRFFPWVWIAIVALPATGYWVIFAVYNGMAATPVFVHVMNALGIAMITLYLWMFFVPYRGLKQAVTAEDWPEGGRQLARIRRIVGTNLTLGLITIVTAAAGRYLG